MYINHYHHFFLAIYIHPVGFQFIVQALEGRTNQRKIVTDLANKWVIRKTLNTKEIIAAFNFWSWLTRIFSGSNV